MDPEQVRALECGYLTRLSTDCGKLEWLATVSLQDEPSRAVSLGSIYTALLTTRPESVPRGPEKVPEREGRRLSAIAVVNAEPHLVLTGDPGSGKRSFVNFLALGLAGERLGAAPRLADLTEPLPGEDGKDEEKAPRQPWDLGALLPVRVILRDFAASPQFPETAAAADAGRLIAFIAADLTAKGHGGLWPILAQRLHQPGVLLLLDGLDEVPRPATAARGWCSASADWPTVRARMNPCSRSGSRARASMYDFNPKRLVPEPGVGSNAAQQETPVP